jgi:VCBS repeat-containing protein
LAPDDPAVTVGEDGVTLTITGEPGATATIYDAQGNPIATVPLGAEGEATYTLPESNGQTVTVTQSDAAGNESGSTPATLPDTLAPDAPTVVVGEDGLTITITGEPGASATIYDAQGNPIATVPLGAEGEATYTLPESNGQAVTVTQSDAAGNESGATPATLPDTLAPDAPTVVVGEDGVTLTITGESGATATIYDAEGNPLATVPLGPTGEATYTLPESNGQAITVTQSDLAGNESGSTPATLPDTLAPSAPVVVVGEDGVTLTITGEPGASATIYDAEGNPLATVPLGEEGEATYTLPESNGQAITVTQSDAAGNESSATPATLPDTLAPDAPTVVVGEDGVTLTITGEPGATATIYDAGGNPIATVPLGAEGEATYTLPETNGQAVTVTQSDGAGNESGSTPATLPDTLAPDAPTVAVGADGRTLTITGEANATATIHNALGQVIATVPLGAGGTATYTLDQSNGQNVLVSQTDAAGNQSEASPATVPDTLAPLAPTDITITPDGVTVSGKGEPNTTVIIRGAGNAVVGEGTVDSSGNFQIGLTTPQREGQQLSVTLQDAAGNLSNPGSVTAPIIDPGSTAPVDDNVTAEVVIQPTTTAVTYPGASYLALVGILGLDLRILSVNSVGITVAQGHQQNLQLTYAQALGVDLAGGTSIIVQKLMPDGTWASVDGNGNATLLTLTLLGNRAEASVLLGEGTYRAFAAVQNTVSVGLLGNLAVSGQDLNYQEPSGIQAPAIQGNVMANDGEAIEAGHLVTSVTVGGVAHAVVAGAQGTTITGQYGTLVIHQDGTYTYTPNASAAAIGQVEQFTYTVHDPLTNANTTANLNIRIDSDGQGLVWSDDFTQPATYDFVATDDTDTSGIVWVNAVNNAFFDQTQPLTALLGGAQSNSNTFTIGSNMDATGTITISVTVAAVASGTVVIQRLVGGTWQNVGTPETYTMTLGLLGVVKTLDVGSLNLVPGQYRVHTTISGVAGSVNTISDVNVTLTDQHVIQSNPGTTGNLLDNDGTLPLAAKLQVQGSGGFVTVSATGTVIQGLHGDLTIYSNGEYKYQPHSNLAYTDRFATDTFNYKIVLPNGHETAAHITIGLEEGSQILSARIAEDPVHDDAVAAEHHETAAAASANEHNDNSDAHTTHQADEHQVADDNTLNDGSGDAHASTETPVDQEATQTTEQTASAEGSGDAPVADQHESDVVPLGDHLAAPDADAGETPAQHSLTEGILLDDGSGEVTLPSSNDQPSSDDSATQTSDTGLGTAPVEETASVDDPLGHLVPDPLTQEDDLHTTHTV